MTVTVRDLLEIRNLGNLKVLGGEDGLDEKISNVNIMDNPDTIKWLQPGEFLLTTGFVFKDNPNLFKETIVNLKSIGCSGLGIKTKRYFDDIPFEMIEESNKIGLPLIEIPYEYSLSQISSIFYKEVYNIQKKIIKKSFDIHSHLMDIVLKGGDISKICSEIVMLIGNPTIILNKKGRLLSYSDSPANPFPLNKYINLNIDEFILKDDFLKKLPNNYSDHNLPNKITLSLKENEITISVKPVIVTNIINGYIIIWETVKRMKQLDYVAIDQAATVISLEMLKQKAIEDAKQNQRKDFFDDLLEGRIESIGTMENLCEVHGLDINKKYICMAIKIKNYEKFLSDRTSENSELKIKVKGIMASANQTAIEGRKKIISIHRRNYVILFLQLVEKDSKKDLRISLKQFGEALYSNIIKSISDLDICIGIGKLHENILDIRLSFDEALDSIKMQDKFSPSRNVVHFDDFLIYHLLDNGTSKEHLNSFYKNTVGKLVDYDNKNNASLVNTLESYFIHNGNISEAAKDIFVHRNTFMYRLDKIKTILSSELKDPEELLEIQLGLKAMHLLQVKK